VGWNRAHRAGARRQHQHHDHGGVKTHVKSISFTAGGRGGDLLPLAAVKRRSAGRATFAEPRGSIIGCIGLNISMYLFHVRLGDGWARGGAGALKHHTWQSRVRPGEPHSNLTPMLPSSPALPICLLPCLHGCEVGVRPPFYISPREPDSDGWRHLHQVEQRAGRHAPHHSDVQWPARRAPIAAAALPGWAGPSMHLAHMASPPNSPLLHHYAIT
jgi:hypothetical protein